MKTAIFFSLLLIATLPLHAEEIYQITDEHGRKTYTNVAPQQPKGTVQKVKLSNTNIRETHADKPAENDNLEMQQNEDLERRLQQNQRQAKNAVTQAETALEEARELRAGDYFNIPGKGLRYTEQYHERIKEAEQQLINAQDNYKASRQRESKPANTEISIDSLWQQPDAPN